jgi:hypothetical protein
MIRWLSALVACLGSSVFSACGRDLELGRDSLSAAAGSPSGHAGAGNAGNAGTATGGAGPCQIRTCNSKTYACGDCIDDDGDGLVDSADPECLGVCDNTEDSYYGGIPGQNSAPCKQDCYFDRDTGPGNDDCHWSHVCDPLSLAPSYPPSGEADCSYDLTASIPGTSVTCTGLRAAQSQVCQDSCLPLTPNGCDCFGCCELPAASRRYVWLGSTVGGVGSCDAAHLEDPELCRPCTPVPSCFNTCTACEICAGRTTPGPDCAEGTVAQCPLGVRPCGLVGQAECVAEEYCVTGCCVPTLG